MPKNFVVYKSSAGSGKTFTLVKEFLRLSLYDSKKLGSNYKRILAITFTNKAAAEMKARVVQSLGEIAEGDTMPKVGSLLCEELHVPEPELRQRAAVVLSEILHHYSDFSIGTIDSFTHKIVKTFAHDLKLPVNFNVELDIQGFYERVISQLLNQVGEDEMVSRLLKEYVLNKAEDNSSWDPEKQIREFTRMLQKEDAEGYIRQLDKFSAEELAAFRDQFADFIGFYRDTLKSMAQNALQLISEKRISDDDFIYKKSGPQAFFRKAAAGAVTLQDAEGPRITEAVSNSKWAGKNVPGAAAIEQIAPMLTKEAAGMIAFIRKHYRFYALASLLSKQIYPLMLLKKIEEITQEQKQEERLVFITEFNQKISDIIHNEPTPFIYERLGEKYQHFLIDEFQDTSRLQWQNILPLLDNSLANGWFNLIVGDGKQSIYRWRNANVRQFAMLPAIENAEGNPLTDERSGTLARNFEERLLNTNYRSLSTIIDFNNTLFTGLSDTLLKEGYAEIYRDQRQEIRNEATGFVTLTEGKVDRDTLDEVTCTMIEGQIRDALANGYAYKDICILARKNYQGNVIAAWLVEHKVPVVSSDSLLLRNNPEINTVVAFLRYLDNSKDHISAATVVTYMFNNAFIGQQQLHEYLERISRDESLGGILSDAGLLQSTGSWELNNLFDNCLFIIALLKMNDKAYHYLRFFLDEVNEFLVTKNAPASFFFEWWESRAQKASMIIPDTMDAVRIMTIHASKGLEFAVVIVPYCNWPVFRSNDSWVKIAHEETTLPVGVISLSRKVAESGFGREFDIEEQEQVLDNLNLLYVAFTRAAERLHIITISGPGNNALTVADWLGKYMQSRYEKKGDTYKIGAPTKRLHPGTGRQHALYSLQPLSFETPADAVKIKPSFLGRNAEAEEAKLQGIILHKLMAAINSLSDVERAVDALVLAGEITVSDRELSIRKVKAILDHPSLHQYYTTGVSAKTEAELITAAGEVLRPDRIVFSGGETVIIDYKTGRENNRKYFRQLELYGSALESMGYKVSKKLLVYVDEPLVIAVN